MSTDWLTRALEESRARGYLGPGPLEPQIDHSRGFVAAWDQFSSNSPTRFLDLGSGGGLPGLWLLCEWSTPGVLLDSMHKRTAFLSEVLGWDGAPTNGTVVTGRAEELARDPDLEGSFELVTARLFGPPAVTVECAVRFVAVGGVIIVSEPPQANEHRWPEAALAALGVRSRGRIREGASFQLLEKVRPTPVEFPRKNGTPRKQPLF